MPKKADYRAVIEQATRKANTDAESYDQIAMNDDAVRKMARQIMQGLRDAGLIIADTSGEDYAQRS